MCWKMSTTHACNKAELAKLDLLGVGTICDATKNLLGESFYYTHTKQTRINSSCIPHTKTENRYPLPTRSDLRFENKSKHSSNTELHISLHSLTEATLYRKMQLLVLWNLLMWRHLCVLFVASADWIMRIAFRITEKVYATCKKRTVLLTVLKF